MKKDEWGDKEADEQPYRGMVTVPCADYARGTSEQFKLLASKQRLGFERRLNQKIK